MRYWNSATGGARHEASGRGRVKGARRHRLLALLAATSLAAAACGARVSPYFPVQSGAGGPAGSGGGGGQALGGGAAATGASATTVAGQAGSGAAQGAAQAGAGAVAAGSETAPGHSAGASPSAAQGAAPAAATALSPANFSYDPRTQASYCTGTAGNTASAPGVTPTSITVGNVSGLSGAVSDTFNAGVQAATAVFDAVNRFGGICGRQLKLDVEDDQQSSSSNASDVQYLVPKVLAFVGSLSDADNGGVPAMVQAGVPDVGAAINTNRSNSAVYWSATGGSVTVRNGRAYIGDAWPEGLKQFNEMPKTIAILSYSIPISAQAGQEYTTLFKDLGVGICYTNYSIPPAPGTVMGSVVSSMQQDNCGGVFTTMDIVGNADMLQDMAADGYHPGLISTTYEGYSPAQISVAGQSNAQGLDVGLSSVPLSDNVPGVTLYQQEMATYEPNQAVTEFGLETWADAEMFIYALVKSGRNPTRASLTAAFNAITGWSSDGAFGPYTPHARTGPPCTSNVVVKGNAFARTWPSSGLYCQGQLVDVGPAS